MQEPKSSVASTTLNLIKNVIAAGIVTLPFVLKESSTVIGLLCMVAVSLLTAYSFWALARCVMLTHAPSYPGLANTLFGARLSWWTLIALICYTLMSEISFIIVIGDFFAPSLRYLGADGWYSTRAFVQCSIAALCLFPLSLLRDLHPLRYMSALGFVCVLYTVFVIVVDCWEYLPSPVDSVEHFDVKTSFFSGIAILSIAFSAQYSIPKLVRELGFSEERRFRLVIVLETLIVLLLYITTAVYGYFRFGSGVEGDIFDNLSHDTHILIGKMSLGVSAIGCFPFAFQVLRACLNEAFGLPNAPRFQFFFTFFIIAFCAGIALAIPKIEVVMAFKGSLFGSFIVFIFPGMFMWRVLHLDPKTLLQMRERQGALQEQQQQQGVGAKQKLMPIGESPGYLRTTSSINGGSSSSDPESIFNQIFGGRSDAYHSNHGYGKYGSEDEDREEEVEEDVELLTSHTQQVSDSDWSLPPEMKFIKPRPIQLILPGFLMFFGAATGIVGFIVTLLKQL